jgi:GNAT superfamily N-acetyltransferase
MPHPYPATRIRATSRPVRHDRGVTLTVAAATADRWDDVAAALGARRPDACWCQRFRGSPGPDHRAALRREVSGDVPIGLLAYVDGAPAGWSRVVPRHTLPVVRDNRALRRLLPDDPAAWWVACVVVHRSYRGRGVGAALVRAAVDHARAHGATVLHGHPVDVARLSARPSASALFTGTVTQFAAAGFTEIGRTYPSRPVLRHGL